ncbi:MAG: hypothetical protein IKK05_03330 [Alistipes sp.]|nr:hypothetical protein [Alistipes sp.]
MKKILFFAALVLGLASCSTDPEDLNVVVGGERDVMLNVSLPEATRSASNAGFDFTNFENNTDYDLRYILEIRYNGKVSRTVKTAQSTSVSFPVRLAPNREYDFTVWADLVLEGTQDDLYYNTDVDGAGLTNITFKEWTPNNELRDAYYGKATLAQDQSITNLGTIELTRPFAKVRVISTDIADVRKFNIEPKSVSVKYINKVYTSFDAVTGVAGTALANQTVSAEYANAKYDDFNTTEATLFADYIFVPEGGTIQFSMDVKTEGDAIIKTTSFTTPIAVEKNKLTTIKGAVLTEGGDVTIKIENGLGELETINLVDTATTLQEIINNTPDGESANITLGGDIDLNDLLTAGTLSTRAAEPTYGLIIPAGKSVVLDLKGFTISQSKTQTAAYSMIENLGTLTIKDDSANKTGKISYADNGQGGEYVSNTIHNSGLLTIEGGIVENNSSATVASNGYPHPIDNSGTLVINDGTFTNNANYSSMRIWCTTDDNTIVTINGGTFNGSIDFQTPSASANKGTLTINGGTFNADTYTKCAVRLLGFGTDVDEMNGYILGGHFNGAIALKKYINGEFNSKVFDITAGTFTTEAKEGTNIALVNDDYAWVEIENGLWTVEHKADVAKIGEVGYTSLAKAVAAVEDGGTITLVADEVFTENNYYDNGGWKDGLGCVGDKSFTLDLNDYTISQNGALNDYLLYFKNNGSKDNTITIKNGTLDAGTTAYSALCTASANEHKITINIEDINLVGNNPSGAVAKIRGGSELNVNAGTVITGKNNYVGIEAVGNNTVVNIYDNVNIYQNGTDSYVGAIVGASYNATMNIYGGYGKSAKCGIIVMSTGATINVSGGEWIANNDGTVATDNYAVLASQNNRNEEGWACKSILNVTGGTFKGGYNCYGMGSGVEPDDAQINIKGGNFNSNPENYVVAGYGSVEDNGIWTVAKAYDITEEGATIYSVAGLKWLAEQVNGGNNFSNKVVKLAADLDLNNEEWTPIGNKDNQFQGTFDGQNKKISNLVITGNNSYVGLFGFTTNGEIKNLVVENAKVSGYLGVGVVAGSPYTSKFNDITVQGHVEVNGFAYVGGVGGRNAYAAWEDITVDVDETSYVNANSVENGTAYRTYVGGVIGFIGEDPKLFKNITSNIDVKGSTIDVGGLFGIAHYGNQFENCSCSGNVEIYAAEEAEEAQEIGGIAGVWNNGGADVVFTNCTFTGTLKTNIAVDFYYGGLIGKPYSATGKGKLIIDGYEMIANGLGMSGGKYYVVSNANGLATLNTMMSNKTAGKDIVVNLNADINFEGKTWTPVDSHADTAFSFKELNGNGHTIYNLTIDGQAMFKRFAGSGDVTVKNITFDNAIVSSASINSSILTGHTYQNVLLDNVDVKNSTINGGYKVAPLIGTVYNESSSTITATLKNCDVENVTVKATSYDFCTTGMVAFVYADDNDTIAFENCTVKDVKLIAPNDGYKAHAAIYTTGSGSLYNEAEGVTVTNVTFEAL